MGADGKTREGRLDRAGKARSGRLEGKTGVVGGRRVKRLMRAMTKDEKLASSVGH